MAMYEKNLNEDFRLRLSSQDMEFLKGLSKERGVSVSECVRSIIGEYRRSLATMKVFSQALEIARDKGADSFQAVLDEVKKEELSHGDTKTDEQYLI